MPADNTEIPAINAQRDATLVVANAKPYVPVVTLSTLGDTKLLQQLKTRFKLTIKWTKYRSEKTNQTKNSNPNYFN